MSSEITGRLPIKVDATSNGEFRPIPVTEHVAAANSEAERRIGEHAKRVGLGSLAGHCRCRVIFIVRNIGWSSKARSR